MNNITVKTYFKIINEYLYLLHKTVDIKLTFLFGFRSTYQCQLICRC